MEIKQLTGKNIILRAPKISDIDDRYQSGRHPEIIHMYGGDTRNINPYQFEDAKRWYQNSLTSNTWIIEYNQKCIGHVRLSIDEANKRARYAIGIHDPENLNKGFGTEATQLILDYAFKILKLHKVDLKVLAYNKRAIACYQKCGFLIEGIDREGALIEDKWESDLMMSILADEYEK